LLHRGVAALILHLAAIEASTSRFPLVHDHSGQALAYGYFEDEPGRGSAAKLLTKDCGAAALPRRFCERCDAGNRNCSQGVK
jgi:hypothetical protein